MRTTKHLSITLPNDMADAVRERVDSGDYASESEVIRDGLRALFARDRAIERWLHGEIAVAYNEASAHPEHNASGEELRAHFDAKRTERR